MTLVYLRLFEINYLSIFIINSDFVPLNCFILKPSHIDKLNYNIINFHIIDLKIDENFTTININTFFK